jgi:hypothetical protein
MQPTVLQLACVLQIEQMLTQDIRLGLNNFEENPKHNTRETKYPESTKSMILGNTEVLERCPREVQFANIVSRRLAYHSWK